jgi:hypothetical protein
MHPKQLKKYKIFDYSSVDNHPKLIKIGKNSSFWAIKATVNKFFPIFFVILGTFYGRKSFRKKTIKNH